MAAPTATDRLDPAATAFYLKNGFKAKITFERNPSICFWEKSVTPPGFDGGAPVDDSTMYNTKYQIQTPRGLATSTPTRAVVAYDPMLFQNEDQSDDPQIEELINVFDVITITFPNNDMLCFYGSLAEFTPNEIVDGSQPTANITIIVCNFDSPIETWPNAEAGPVLEEA